jgi:hypothetical protein
MTSAILGASRLGNFRLGYVPATTAAMRLARIHVLLAGADITLLTSAPRTLVGSVSVHDALNDNPNTASLLVKGAAPTVGQSLRITVGTDTPILLFTGTVQTVDLSYVGRGTLEWTVTATDDLARLNQRRPFGTWTNVSATTIAQALIATYAPGFTSVNVQAALPAISLNLDGSEGFSGTLKQIAQLIGGYFYVEDLDLHLFTSEATGTPDPVDATHRQLDDPPITMNTDLSQVRTRVYGKGHGEALLADVAIGETILPVANATAWFNGLGGKAMAVTQVLTYTGLHLGGAGSTVGPGAAPSVAPAGTLVKGAHLGAGVYQYAYTFITAAGESLPSPAGPVTTSAHLPAPAAPSWSSHVAGSQADGWYGWAATFVDSAGETTASPVMVTFLNGLQGLFLTAIAIGPADVTSRKLYRTQAQASAGAALTAQLKLLTTIADNTTTTYNDTSNDAVLGANVPTSNTAAAYQDVNVTGIAIGASPTTSRKVYRTAVGGAQLKLLATIADNTTTTYADIIADGSLGANAPTSDTSGLTQPSGQVNAGSTSLLLASAGPFASGGGWVQVGAQLVRYTGLSGNTLTGIPASGVGALANTVKYGEHADPAPALTGVSGVVVAILSGTTINLWVQRDDTIAQAAMAAMDGTAGIYEYFVSDERRNEAGITALCDATLALYKSPTVTVTYASRDTKTKSGKPITINLANPPISQTLTIQSVDISELSIAPTGMPKFTVTASNVRFSLDSMLRQLLGKAA